MKAHFESLAFGLIENLRDAARARPQRGGVATLSAFSRSLC